jgi:hypothetical protein
MIRIPALLKHRQEEESRSRRGCRYGSESLVWMGWDGMGDRLKFMGEMMLMFVQEVIEIRGMGGN